MRYRVTSIAAEEVGRQVSEVTVRLEDWLNSSLSDGDFGGNLDQITMFVVSVFKEREENERWAAPRNRLGGFTNPCNGERVRDLSFAVVISPAELATLDFKDSLQMVSAALSAKLIERPKRVPKHFEYERWAKSVRAALGVYATA